MSREIKYRCQNSKGVWEFSGVTCFVDDFFKQIESWKKETLGQFTGLQDKNGRDSYEGDITACGKQIMFSNGIFAPHYDFGQAEVIEDIGTDWWSSIEIIGNIHDDKPILDN